MPETLPPSFKPVNVAVVGLGFMGTTHLRVHLRNPGARVVAVCSPTRTPVDGVLSGVSGNIQQSDDIRLEPSVKIFRQIEDLLADSEVELVDICTPTALHPAQVITALRAGKHVICEKPLARTSKLAREILTAATQSAGLLMPAMCMRFWPGWSWLKQVVSEKTYGKVLAASFRRISEMPLWSRQDTFNADSGGALFDLHIHDVDFINFVFGRPASIFSSGFVSPSGAINHVVTQYNYPNGPAVQAEGSWLLNQGFNMSYTFYCERATLDFDLARGADALIIIENGQRRVMRLENGDGYDAELRYVVDCAARGRQPETVTAKDSVTALEICEAEETSLRTGRIVSCVFPNQDQPN